MDAKTGIDQSWLEVRCHPEGEFKPLLFLHSWATQGQNQPVDQVAAAAILKYGQKCTWPILENRAYDTLLPTE